MGQCIQGQYVPDPPRGDDYSEAEIEYHNTQAELCGVAWYEQERRRWEAETEWTYHNAPEELEWPEACALAGLDATQCRDAIEQGAFNEETGEWDPALYCLLFPELCCDYFPQGDPERCLPPPGPGPGPGPAPGPAPVVRKSNLGWWLAGGAATAAAIVGVWYATR